MIGQDKHPTRDRLVPMNISPEPHVSSNLDAIISIVDDEIERMNSLADQLRGAHVSYAEAIKRMTQSAATRQGTVYEQIIAACLRVNGQFEVTQQLSLSAHSVDFSPNRGGTAKRYAIDIVAVDRNGTNHAIEVVTSISGMSPGKKKRLRDRLDYAKSHPLLTNPSCKTWIISVSCIPVGAYFGHNLLSLVEFDKTFSASASPFINEAKRAMDHCFQHQIARLSARNSVS